MSLRNSTRGDELRRHLLVAGTGRAGTSALVRYLTGLGLETHLSRNGEASVFDDEALAGLEDLALPSVLQDLPYVVKSPWSYQIIEEVLDDPTIALDAVVVPVRDLVSAATSRTVREMQAMHQAAPWMVETSGVWEHWGLTPGGTVFSLNPIDQARLLALGFHQLIERLVRADVPILLLAFPRFATDPDYLYRKLAPLLPADIDISQAREVHAATFEAAKVRVEREFIDADEPASSWRGVGYRTLRELDNAALRRETKRLRSELEVAHEQSAALMEENKVLRSEVEAGKALVGAAENKCIALETEHKVQCDQLERRAMAAETKCAALGAECLTLDAGREVVENELAVTRDQLHRDREEKNLLLLEMLALRASRSWRLTQPLRTIASAIKLRAAARS